MFGITLVIAAVCTLSAAEFDPDLHAKFNEMHIKDFIEYFNKKNYTWKMKDYSLTFPPCNCTDSLSNNMTLSISRRHPTILQDLPDSFDARKKWPQCETIHKIYNQGDCGSCWTYGTATTASDRTCIHKNIHVELAEQDFECMQECVCYGGSSYEAFGFWRDQGLVSSACKPYNITQLHKNECRKECSDPSIEYAKDKHFADKVYILPADEDIIKSELFQNGPIKASYAVYEDFRYYSSGIYVNQFGDLEARHSVRVIGYGVENNQKYWLATNSWGTDWGENGLFRIETFQKDLKFESNMNSGIPKN